MKGKIIKPNDKYKKKIIESITLLILGIILVTNSNQAVTIIFQIIGVGIILFGIYKLHHYLMLKKQFKMEDSDSLISSIISITIGLLIILLASILEVGLRYIIGFYLIINGISKSFIALSVKNQSPKFFYLNIVVSIIYILLGLYTIFIANAAFLIIGIILIFSSLLDLVTCLKK